MRVRILAFGIAKEIISGKSIEFELDTPFTLANLKEQLTEKYPDFKKLRSLKLAVNESYQEDSFEINESDEVVIIPPVSGG